MSTRRFLVDVEGPRFGVSPDLMSARYHYSVMVTFGSASHYSFGSTPTQEECSDVMADVAAKLLVRCMRDSEVACD